MKIAGIIAEYNPFHNGHAYQLKELKKRTGADYIIAAMSGDFMQRGAPAMMDKYARSRMALSAGVDLVVELPVLWASASAEHFAAAGVTLFDKMGCIDYLCFGAETDNLTLLTSIAAILAEEPLEYQTALSSCLKSGMTFPAARAQALSDYCANTENANCFSNREELQTTLSSPNNILAIEYLKTLHRRSSAIQPILIKREGAGYHEETIEIKNASASAIRKLLISGGTDNTEPTADNSMASALSHALPMSCYDAIHSYRKLSPFLTADDFSAILGYLLVCQNKNSLAAIADCNEDIANRMFHNRFSFRSFTQFCELVKSRDITYSRMSRVLMHMILQHTKEDYALGISLDYIPYLRILGFRKDAALPPAYKTGEPLLSYIKKSAEVPLISKLAAAKNLLSVDALCLLKKDIFAADLYEQIKFVSTDINTTNHSLPKKAENEYTQKLILL